MSKGIIYVMTTAVDGLIKIGKTAENNFNNRMYFLERNGYFNVAGLKRKFAILVEDYDEKEKLLHQIFEKNNLNNSELFALDIDLIIKLLSSFEGEQIYPVDKTKNEIFNEASQELKDKKDIDKIENQVYYLNKKVNKNKVSGKMRVQNNQFIVLKGSICSEKTKPHSSVERRTAIIKNGILMEDVVCKSPSSAASVIVGGSANGWDSWKDKNGIEINQFRD